MKTYLKFKYDELHGHNLNFDGWPCTRRLPEEAWKALIIHISEIPKASRTLVLERYDPCNGYVTFTTEELEIILPKIVQGIVEKRSVT